MTLAILAGTGVGAAIWLIVSGLAPAPVPLQQALARLGQPSRQPDTGADSFDARLGSQLRRRIPLMDRATEAMSADLRVLHRDPDEQAAQIAAYVLVGLLWAPAVNAGALLLGIRIPWVIPGWLALAGAAAAALVSVRHVRTEAREAREAFAHALSAYCDVVAMNASAGLELHAAIFDAARRGQGWAFDELLTALERGFHQGERPWDTLSKLGQDMGAPDLVDIAATLALSADEGASVAETLTSKARSIRERLVSDAERRAASATERMAVPGAMILIGFLWLLAWPALQLILEEAGR